ncbi:MAG: cytochrome P450 [marine actinobacterium MedAcidi-G2A]|nr:MAG: cytochrome P450 [marine actinobacterium MedAcidi-G2A]MBA4810399.1 cytochrome P450 [Acidimicrobiales bacterium]OUV00386.1 MAG: cytochrome P450 [Acidimicrobiaceae bacterium TMED77]|tara:strand:- start:895 stop:2145 length:1251 start_codon:yes stop_codon:yes gene_type:complete
MEIEGDQFELDKSFLDPVTQDDPFEAYDELRQHCPVYKLPETGLFMVTRYEDVREVLTTSSVFSSRPGAGAGGANEASKAHAAVFSEKGWVKARTLQRTDPPEHTQYRKILGRVFTNRTVERMRPRLEEITNQLIDNFIDRGSCEFVSEFALPLPGIFICEQLGLPAEEYGTFKKWADAMLAMSQKPLSPEEATMQAELEVEAQHHLAKEFKKRREEPADDLISLIVHAHEDDEPFTMEELQDLMHQLVTGGFETTTAAISKAMLLLLQYPDQMEKLRSDPSLIKNFIEESLRFDSPVAGLWRTTACPVDIGGASIPEGSPVMPRFASANRDPEMFESPEKFDIERENVNQHMAFGLGSHFCLGASLARAELLAAFTIILDRLDDIHLIGEMGQEIHNFSFFLRPMKELNIGFSKK